MIMMIVIMIMIINMMMIIIMMMMRLLMMTMMIIKMRMTMIMMNMNMNMMIFSKGHNFRKGDNFDKKKKKTGPLFFHEEFIYEISKP